MTTILAVIAGTGIGLFVGLWSSNEYHETRLRDFIAAGTLEFKGKFYRIDEWVDTRTVADVE